MQRSVIISLGLVGVFLITAVAQEKSNSSKAPAQDPAKRVAENPDDVEAMNAYMSSVSRRIAPLITSDPQAAQKELDEMRALLDKLQPTTDASKRLLLRARSLASSYESRIELAQTTVEQLQKRLLAKPDDAKTLMLLTTKISQELAGIARSNPTEAEARLNAAKAFLVSIKDQAQNSSVQAAVDSSLKSWAPLERTIAARKRINELIGQDAAPLDVAAWLNGSPLANEDLKGKVVLLDFWAVWCGPCVNTFPHLREWNEKYKDKGLVMIGLTRYYKNFAWDDSANKLKRVPEALSPEDEQQMLTKFVQFHKLGHRIGVQTDSKLYDFYGVSGIPEVVVIDRQGKVRLIRVGSGEPNAKDIEAMLEKLVGEGI